MCCSVKDQMPSEAEVEEMTTKLKERGQSRARRPSAARAEISPQVSSRGCKTMLCSDACR